MTDQPKTDQPKRSRGRPRDRQPGEKRPPRITVKRSAEIDSVTQYLRGLRNDPKMPASEAVEFCVKMVATRISESAGNPFVPVNLQPSRVT